MRKGWRYAFPEFQEWNSPRSQNRVTTGTANPPLATPAKDGHPQFRNGTSRGTPSQRRMAPQPAPNGVNVAAQGNGKRARRTARGDYWIVGDSGIKPALF